MPGTFSFTPRNLLVEYYKTIPRFQNYGHRFTALNVRDNQNLERAHDAIRRLETLTLFDFIAYQGDLEADEFAEIFAEDEGPRALGVILEILGHLELARQDLEKAETDRPESDHQ